MTAQNEMTTRRAIEIVLSRVAMPKYVSSHLLQCLPKPTETDSKVSPEEMLSAIMRIEDYAEGVSDFPRTALISRLALIHDVCRTVSRQ